MSKFTKWMKSEKGASMVEYALLVILIAIVALLAVSFVGTENSRMYSDISSAVSVGP